jgi:hypothetical protein
MLMTDSIYVTSSDLSRIDSEVATVAAAEGITLDGAGGLIRGAVEEVANELSKLIVAFGGYLSGGDWSVNHLAAVFNYGLGTSVKMKAALSQVVVSGNSSSEWNHVKQWAVFWTLRSFYRDAFGRTVKDRYKDKMVFFKEEIDRRLKANLWTLGVPCVIRPLARPAAMFERGSGSWSTSNISLVAGSGTRTDKVDVAITYVDMSQPNFYASESSNGNSESDASDTLTQLMVAGHNLHVDISTLNPPTGVQDKSQQLIVVIAPLKATHWNVWAGTSGSTLYLQNAAPISIATTSYTLPADPLLSGPAVGIGQYSDRRLALLPLRQRA